MKDLADIRKLPVAERLLLPVSDELIQELESRLAAHRKAPGTAIPWEDVDREVFGAD